MRNIEERSVLVVSYEIRMKMSDDIRSNGLNSDDAKPIRQNGKTKKFFSVRKVKAKCSNPKWNSFFLFLVSVSCVCLLSFDDVSLWGRTNQIEGYKDENREDMRLKTTTGHDNRSNCLNNTVSFKNPFVFNVELNFFQKLSVSDCDVLFVWEKF